MMQVLKHELDVDESKITKLLHSVEVEEHQMEDLKRKIVANQHEIESLRGFDFFPQTGHVEGVCVLSRVEDVDAKVEVAE